MTKHVLGNYGTRAEAMALAARRAVFHLRLRPRESTRGDTEHLLKSPANAARLRAALESSLAAEAMRVSGGEPRARVGLGEP